MFVVPFIYTTFNSWGNNDVDDWGKTFSKSLNSLKFSVTFFWTYLITLNIQLLGVQPIPFCLGSSQFFINLI